MKPSNPGSCRKKIISFSILAVVLPEITIPNNLTGSPVYMGVGYKINPDASLQNLH